MGRSFRDLIQISDEAGGAGDLILIGYRADGRPIYNIAGGSRNTFEAWIPEEFDSDVITRVNQVSVVESLAAGIPMKTDSRSVPRSAGVDVDVVDKGASYNEDGNANDEVVLTAKKFGRVIRIAEEDIDDSLADIVATKQRDWATSFGKAFDNASLAVSAAVGTGVPFTSVYKTVRTTDSGISYTADTNYTATGSGGTTYANLSSSLAKIEVADYFDETEMVVIAHPKFRSKFRGIVDTQNRPVFIQGLAGTPDTLFGLPVRWSLGAKVSATATSSPTGNPLLIYVNRMYLLRGVRSGPESILIDGRSGASTLTDESLLKMRARRAFALGHALAASVLEDNSGS
jgi:HK97 family phage major capsid protein